MDMSKLPKLSNTSKPAEEPPDQQPQPAPVYPDYEPRGSAPYIGAEVWLALVIGLFLMMIGRSFPVYLVTRMTGHAYHTNVTWQMGPQAGQEVSYWDLLGFTALTDMALFIFGLACVFEGAAILFAFARYRGSLAVVRIAFLLAIAATGLNIYVCMRVLAAGITPTFSFLAAAFGGYMVFCLWGTLRTVHARVARG